LEPVIRPTEGRTGRRVMPAGWVMTSGADDDSEDATPHVQYACEFIEG